MAEYKTFQKKKRYSPKKTIRQFCTIVIHSVLLCYTAMATSDESDGYQNDPGHPDNEWE